MPLRSDGRVSRVYFLIMFENVRQRKAILHKVFMKSPTVPREAFVKAFRSSRVGSRNNCECVGKYLGRRLDEIALSKCSLRHSIYSLRPLVEIRSTQNSNELWQSGPEGRNTPTCRAIRFHSVCVACTLDTHS